MTRTLSLVRLVFCTLCLLFSLSAAAQTTVDFDTPTPGGSSGALLNGVFEGIDFGSGQWRWEEPYLWGPTNHIYFASGSGLSRSFTFTSGPQVLQSISVFGASSGTLTLSDNQGQSVSQTITTGSMQLVTTGWSLASTTVTVEYSSGWDLGVDDIVYVGEASDTTPPTVALTAPADGATLSGNVVVSATAADDQAVASVAFRIDGRPLGVVDTTFPYEITWDTVTTTNGSYTVGAIATDTAGNQTSASTINVTVSNASTNIDRSVRFFGNGVNAPDQDRIKIPIDDPTNTDPGPPADIGAEDFTLEFWMKARPGDNPAAGTVTCGAGNDAIYGNIIFDRDRYNQDRGFVLSIADRRLVWGVDGDGTGSLTLCGLTPIDDDTWHHVAVLRRRSDGMLWLFVDGNLEAQLDGPDGDISYPDDGVPGPFCGPSGGEPCTNSDPFLVIGAEKHDAGQLFPSYNGHVDNIRISNSLRYAGSFSVPTGPFVTDANTVALYDLNEALGSTAVLDRSGAPGGPSNGSMNMGGTPAGPLRSGDAPFGPKVTIDSPTAGQNVVGTTLTVTYSPFGNLTETDHIHFQIDDGPERPDHDFDGSIVLENIPVGTHLLSAYLVRSNHTHITGIVDARVTFTNTVDPSDTTPPSVSLLNPQPNATVSGTINISANATDNVALGIVEFYLDSQLLSVGDAIPPYEITWNSTGVANGSYVLTAIAQDVAGNRTTSAAVPITVSNGGQSTDPAVIGEFAAPFTMPIVGVNLVLLHTGDVLMWDGDAEGADARLWNPATGQFTAAPNFVNQFCAGHVTLDDGRVLVVGGHDGSFIGLPDVNFFDPVNSTWSAAAPMAQRRWYPTTTTLGDNRVLALSGSTTCETCLALIPEVYDPAANTWTLLNSASLSIPRYPLVFLLTDGRILLAGSDEANTDTQTLDVDAQSWTMVDPVIVPGGSAAMYQPNVILKAGSPANVDLAPSPAVNTAYVLDMNQSSPSWRQVGSMAFPRAYHTLTNLPDGSVIATGGLQTTDEGDDAQAVYAVEIFDPSSETWSTMDAGQEVRTYHSTGLLLPDGRVLVAGSGRLSGINDNFTGEIFSPPYLFRGARPNITSAPATITYGGSFFVGTPEGADISRAALVRPGAVTHGFDQNQKYVELNVTATTGGVSVQAPAGSTIAPAGYYMLFLVNTAGIPSVAEFVNLGGTSGSDTTPPTAPTNLVGTGGLGRIDLSWTASTDNVSVSGYQIYRATSPGVAPSPATLLAQTSATSYADTGVTPGTYYYQVTAEDGSGNVSAPSTEVSATAQTDLEAPSVTVTDPANGATVSGTVTLQANATDNVAVVGVQFLVDGVNVGAEDTTAPFAVAWDTGTLANGIYAISARARDAAGNTTTSSDIALVVDNQGPPTGLVAAFGFNEGQGSAVTDLSGNGNNGTVSGAAWTTQGRFGNALSFDGNDDWVTIADSASLDLSAGMTLEGWINPTTVPSQWRTLVAKEGPGTVTYFLHVSSGTDQPATGVTVSGNEVHLFGGGGTQVAVNTWTHLAATYDGTTQRLYINGQEVASRAQSGPIATSSQPLRIGGNSMWGEYFSGLIDEVRVYNRALSAAEIQADLNTPL